MRTIYALFLLSLSICGRAKDFMELALQQLSPSVLLLRFDYCPEDLLQRLLMAPKLPVALESLNSSSPPNEQFSRVLQLICLQNIEYPADELNIYLDNIRGPRSIFYIAADNSKSNSSASKRVLTAVLRECYRLKILHVIAVLAEEAHQIYYRYRPYPRFELEQRPLELEPFFRSHLDNMQGEPLVVLPDQKHPRTVLYTDWRTGRQVLAGSVGRFVRTLAWKLNATIMIPAQIKPGKFMHFNELESLLEQLHVDVPATVVQLMRPEQLPLSSFPFELSHICMMIPLAQQLPIKDIYLIVGNVRHILLGLAIVSSFGLLLGLHRRLAGQSVILSDFVVNDVALRGLLGQSFGRSRRISIHVSWIYLMLAVLGLNLGSIHEAALGTLLTHPPKYFQPRSFADIERAQLPLVLDGDDLESGYNLSEFRMRVLRLRSSEYNNYRDKMNMSHAYFASRLKWTLLSEQQKYFPRAVFLYSMDACIRSLTHMVFQLPKNSWFLEPITKLIMDVRDTGLFQHWVDMHFYDMAAAELLSFSDPIQRDPQRLKAALCLEDLQWIWIAYGSLHLLATLVFIIEIVLNRVRGKLASREIYQ